MTQAELDAAVKVAYDAIADKMVKGGWGNWVSKIDERKSELVDIVQFALQAAEDVRRGK